MKVLKGLKKIGYWMVRFYIQFYPIIPMAFTAFTMQDWVEYIARLERDSISLEMIRLTLYWMTTLWIVLFGSSVLVELVVVLVKRFVEKKQEGAV